MFSYTYKKQIKRGLTPFYFLKIAEHKNPLFRLKGISTRELTGVGLVHQRVRYSSPKEHNWLLQNPDECEANETKLRLELSKI